MSTPTPKLPPNLSNDQLSSFRPYTSWLSSLTASLSQQHEPTHPFHKDPYTLRSLTVSHVDFFGHGRVGFLNVTAELKNSSDESLPGTVFLRGGSVAMLVILQEEEGGEEWVLLTVQPRVPAGGALEFVELPAGMLDGDTFSGAAAKEIKEECGIEIKADGLVDLTELAFKPLAENAKGANLESAVYPSPGGTPTHTVTHHSLRITNEMVCRLR
jgi:ADP-sugar diphosphatase